MCIDRVVPVAQESVKILEACERDGGVNLLENSRKTVLTSSSRQARSLPPWLSLSHWEAFGGWSMRDLFFCALFFRALWMASRQQYIVKSSSKEGVVFWLLVRVSPEGHVDGNSVRVRSVKIPPRTDFSICSGRYMELVRQREVALKFAGRWVHWY